MSADCPAMYLPAGPKCQLGADHPMRIHFAAITDENGEDIYFSWPWLHPKGLTPERHIGG